MLFGHNSNVTVGDKIYHVQTEDRGTTRALLDTTVYCGGRVVHRRTSTYFELVPLDASREEKLKVRLNTQHQGIVDELQRGTLQLSSSPATQEAPATSRAKPVASSAAAATNAPKSIALELVNAREWLSGKRATLHVAVRDAASGAGISGARVSAHIDGAAEPGEFSTATGTQGQARLAFDMPTLAGSEAALVIEASHGPVHGQLRFQLRTKPKVPTAR